MNNNFAETAQWKTQYYIEVDPGNGESISPSSGWFDEGDTVKFTAEPYQSLRIESSFSGWNNYISESPVLLVVIDSPKKVQARAVLG